MNSSDWEKAYREARKQIEEMRESSRAIRKERDEYKAALQRIVQHGDYASSNEARIALQRHEKVVIGRPLND